MTKIYACGQNSFFEEVLVLSLVLDDRTCMQNTANTKMKNIFVIFANMQSIDNRTVWFYAEPCKGEKHAQEDKRKQASDRARYRVDSISRKALPMHKNRLGCQDERYRFAYRWLPQSNYKNLAPIQGNL